MPFLTSQKVNFLELHWFGPLTLEKRLFLICSDRFLLLLLKEINFKTNPQALCFEKYHFAFNELLKQRPIKITG